MPDMTRFSPRIRYAGLAAACVVLAGLGPVSTADAKRHVGFGTLGVNLAPEASSTLSAAQMDTQLQNMALAGVESVRTDFSWQRANPKKGVYNWKVTDKLVHATATAGIDLLPVVQFTPRWASSRPNAKFNAQYAPKSYSYYGTFLKAAIHRYGPNGTYWSSNKSVPKRPLRYWGLWNEPSQPFPWQTRPWAKNYVKLLKAGYKAVHAADHGAKVLTASLSGHGAIKGSPSEQTPKPVWGDVADLYKAGGKKYFDIVSVNFYTNAGGISVGTSVAREFLGAKFVRAEMNKRGDKKKPIWLTEVTWLSSRGKVPASNYSGKSPFEPVPTTSAGQAARLDSFYRKLGSGKGTYGVKRAFWFTWGSPYTSHTRGFDYAGLNSWVVGGPFKPKPLLDAYRSVARSLEGCKKTTSARRCG